jgi:hypothetical protein
MRIWLPVEDGRDNLVSVPWFRARDDGPAVVRCRDGHLFSTVWVPFGSFKALRFGRLRFQRCPVGDHWTFVERVDDELTDTERQLAALWFDDAGP